ncbi:MAG: PKD domain-containing protein [bacterium]
MVGRILGFLLAAAAATTLLLLVHPASANTGGPDGCGYYFIDSNSGGGPAYDFVDISTTGTAGPAGDDVSTSVSLSALPPPLPGAWEFDFCGNAVQKVELASNGYLCFDAGTCTSYTPQTIPSSCCGPYNFVSAYWTDLNSGSCVCTYYQVVGTSPNRVFIYEMNNVPYYSPSSSSPGSWEIKLFEVDDSIEVHYQSVAPVDDNHHAIGGLQDNTGNSGLTWLDSSASSDWTLNSVAVRYYRGAAPPANQAPVATPATYTVDEDCSTTPASGCASPYATITLAGTDADPGDPMYFCIASNPTRGVLKGNPPSCNTVTAAASPTYDVKYQPNDDYCNGPAFSVGNDDAFTFKVKDGSTFSATAAKATIQVTCIADVPIATADAYNVDEDCSPLPQTSCAAVTPSYFGVPATCTGSPPFGLKCSSGEKDRDDLASPVPVPSHISQDNAVVFTGPSSGQLLKGDGTGTSPVISSDGSFRYIPNVHFCGTDSFKYELLDDNSPTGLTPPTYSAPVQVTLTVACTIIKPYAGDDTYNAASGYSMSTLARGLSPVLANDGDTDGDTVVPSVCVFPTTGSLVGTPPIAADGHFIYAAPASFTGPVTFTYKVTDPDPLDSPCATVTINVAPDVPPVARFSASPTTVVVGNSVTFVDSSTDSDPGDSVVAWNWNFGDGYKSTSHAPDHIFGTVGQATVCLSAIDSYGAEGSPTCKAISVVAPTGGAPPPQNPPTSGGSQGSGGASGGSAGSGGDLGGSGQLLAVSAGADRTTATGSDVSLQATATGASGAVLWSWTQTAGPAAALSGADTPTLSFKAPSFDGPVATLYFEVAASDGSARALDGVMVTVRPTNAAPTATILVPEPASVGATVMLDGTASSDPDGDLLTYQWMQVAGPSAVLSDAQQQTASFAAVAPGTYRFSLVVDDGLVSAMDQVEIQVTDAASPTSTPISPGSGPSGTFEGFTVVQGDDGLVSVTPTVSATSYDWDFGDGTPAETSQGAATHRYATPGGYTISMKAHEGSGATQVFQGPTTVASAARARDVSSPGTSGVAMWAIGAGAIVLAAILVAAIVAAGRKR